MGVSATAVARVVGIETAYINLRGSAAVQLPQRVAVVGQGSESVTYATTPVTHTSSGAVGAEFGFGSPLHLASLMLLPANGDGLGDVPMTLYPVQADGSGVQSLGDITPVGTTQSATAEYTVLIGGIPSAKFVIEAGTVVLADIGEAITAAVNGNVNMPMIAADTVPPVSDLTAKWKGAATDDLTVSIEGPSNGITFTFTQPTGGAVNPDIQAALDNITNIWETLVVNCMEHDDTTTLDLIETWGLGRWGTLVKKPVVALTGYTETTTAAGIVIGEARKATDRINGYITALGSASLPLQVAARGAARIARQANDNPPVGYATQLLDGVSPGLETLQLGYPDLDASVKAGVSTSKLVGGVVALEDVVTFYHPDGEIPPAYQYVVQIMKMMQTVFNLNLIFESEGWAAAPLIPDDQPTTNPEARKPSAAKAEVNAMIDGLGLAAILSDPATAKGLTTADINGTNPNRLDVTITVQYSGNTNIISIEHNFGFFFGTAALAA